MAWGIAPTATEIKKIKAESADYLGGLNSVGEIDYSTYDKAFDFYESLLNRAYELGKKESNLGLVPDEDGHYYYPKRKDDDHNDV